MTVNPTLYETLGEFDAWIFTNKVTESLKKVALDVVNHGKKGSVTITLDIDQIRAVSDAKDVKLKFRIGQMELIKQRIAEEFRARIKANIDTEGLSIFIGDMDYQK